MDTINNIIGDISSFLWGWPMVIMLLGTHLYLTFILKFPQRKLLKAIKLSVTPDKNSSGDVSQFLPKQICAEITARLQKH